MLPKINRRGFGQKKLAESRISHHIIKRIKDVAMTSIPKAMPKDSGSAGCCAQNRKLSTQWGILMGDLTGQWRPVHHRSKKSHQSPGLQVQDCKMGGYLRFWFNTKPLHKGFIATLTDHFSWFPDNDFGASNSNLISKTCQTPRTLALAC